MQKCSLPFSSLKIIDFNFLCHEYKKWFYHMWHNFTKIVKNCKKKIFLDLCRDLLNCSLICFSLNLHWHHVSIFKWFFTKEVYYHSSQSIHCIVIALCFTSPLVLYLLFSVTFKKSATDTYKVDENIFRQFVFNNLMLKWPD